MSIKIGTLKNFEYVKNQGDLKRHDRYRIHVIECDWTICNQWPITVGWDIKMVESIDDMKWLCKNCLAVLERRELEKLGHELEQARLAALPVQMTMFK